MRYRILAVVSTLAVAGGLMVAGAQHAGAQQEFTLVAHQTNFVCFPVNGLPTSNPGQGTPCPRLAIGPSCGRR